MFSLVIFHSSFAGSSSGSARKFFLYPTLNSTKCITVCAFPRSWTNFTLGSVFVGQEGTKCSRNHCNFRAWLAFRHVRQFPENFGWTAGMCWRIYTINIRQFPWISFALLALQQPNGPGTPTAKGTWTLIIKPPKNIFLHYMLYIEFGSAFTSTETSGSGLVGLTSPACCHESKIRTIVLQCKFFPRVHIRSSTIYRHKPSVVRYTYTYLVRLRVEKFASTM